jgi:predicted peptidase
MADPSVYPYLTYLPRYYHRSKKKWPLLLFLHGAGERGNDLDMVKRHGPPKLAEAGQSFPFILVAPQCPEGKKWPVQALNRLLNELTEKLRIDEKRIYLTGLSLGGYGTWKLAIRYPRRFAAIVPICGWGDPQKVGVLRDVPIWVFHGAKDTVVPLQKSRELVSALRTAGGPVKFTIYRESGHDAWTQTYEKPGLYAWILKHHLKAEKA